MEYDASVAELGSFNILDKSIKLLAPLLALGPLVVLVLVLLVKPGILLVLTLDNVNLNEMIHLFCYKF